MARFWSLRELLTEFQHHLEHPLRTGDEAKKSSSADHLYTIVIITGQKQQGPKVCRLLRRSATSQVKMCCGTLSWAVLVPDDKQSSQCLKIAHACIPPAGVIM